MIERLEDVPELDAEMVATFCERTVHLALDHPNQGILHDLSMVAEAFTPQLDVALGEELGVLTFQLVGWHLGAAVKMIEDLRAELAGLAELVEGEFGTGR